MKTEAVFLVRLETSSFPARQEVKCLPGVPGTKILNPLFLGFFGFVKTIKLLVTQKQLRQELKITARA
jgi:hypothetical protein